MTRTGSGSKIPGNRGDSRDASMASAPLRAHSTTSFPARAAWTASAVPQAPAPTMAISLISQPHDQRRLTRLAIAEPFQQRIQYHLGFPLEPVRRIDDRQPAAGQPRGVQRFAQQQLGG